MRKGLTILLASMYLITTSGIVISTHYCMGEVAGHALGQNDAHLCSVCGMANEGCCHDDVSLIKIDDDHHAVNIINEIQYVFIRSYDYVSINTRNYLTSSKSVHSYGKAPPIVFNRQAILCVFRI